MNPVFVPLILNSDDDSPPECPSCGKPERIIEACAHCGHEYEEDEPGSWWVVLTIILAFIVGSWLVFTVGGWLVDQAYGQPQTLLEAVLEQWEFVKGLRLW